MSHTPGPWTWGNDFRGLYGSGENNEVLSTAYYEGMWLTHGEKQEANAKLIASAPALLATLEIIAGLAPATGAGYPMSVVGDLARAAIERATQ